MLQLEHGTAEHLRVFFLRNVSIVSYLIVIDKYRELIPNRWRSHIGSTFARKKKLLGNGLSKGPRDIREL